MRASYWPPVRLASGSRVHRMKVFVYWNLHKYVFSVKYRGRVIAHARDFILADADFVVSEAGRQRVLASGRKNVHAGIKGEMIACNSHSAGCDRSSPMLPEWETMGEDLASRIKQEANLIRYNPYESGSFVTCGRGTPIEHAALVFGHAGRLNKRAILWAQG